MYRASRCCRILGNPTAYSILKELGASRMIPSELSRRLGCSVQNISKTLKEMRQVDLVRYESRGNTREYRIKDTLILKGCGIFESFVDKMRKKED